MLELRQVGVRYGEAEILRDISLTTPAGQWLMVLGPNGAGKSTLVNAVMQSAPYSGEILYGGENLKSMKPAAMARKIGALSQQHHVAYAFTVEEVVRLGRYAWGGGVLQGANPGDDAAVEEALAATGMAGLRRQSVLTLSGGELQRTFLAQVMAQSPELLMLDEPANHLDLVYQQQVFDLVREWLKTPGRAAVSVVHDLSLARAYGSHALLLRGGQMVSHGPIGEVLSRERLREVYEMDVYGWMQRMLAQWGE